MGSESLWKRSKMTYRINKKPKKGRKKTGFQFVASPPPDAVRVWDHIRSCKGFVFQLEWIAGQKEQRKKTEDLSAFCFYYSPKNTNPFSESCYDSVFCSSNGCLQTAEAQPVHMEIKVQQRSPSHPTHSVEVILDFQFFFFLKHNSVSFKTFLQERKEQSVILCNNNNKKNYRPLSR